MTAESQDRQVEIAEDGRVVGVADVRPVGDSAVVRAALHVEAGHLRVGTSARLVDAVLDLPETKSGERLEATIPIGDTESLDRLRERCETVETRPAGATCLVDATLPTPKEHRQP